MSTKESKWRKLNSAVNKWSPNIWFFVFFGIAVLLIPVFLTQISILDYTETGGIGDTIGGISAPFIGLLSAFLVYKAFLMQFEANKALQSERSMSLIQYLLENIKENIDIKHIKQLELGYSNISKSGRGSTKEKKRIKDAILTPLTLGVHLGKNLLENKFALDQLELLTSIILYLQITSEFHTEIGKIFKTSNETQIPEVKFGEYMEMFIQEFNSYYTRLESERRQLEMKDSLFGYSK